MNESNLKLLQQHIDILSFRDLSEGTVKTYTSYLSQFLEWTETLSVTSLSDITWDQLRTYFQSLKSVRKLDNRTINVHIAQLRDFYRYVLHIEWDRYQIPYLRVNYKLPAVPTFDEVNSIIDSISNIKHRSEIALLYSSGIRVSELCRLKCGDIYASKKLIYISKSKNRSDRYAVLSEKALKLLVRYIRTLYRNAKPDDWLFPGMRPESHITDESVRLIFKRALISVGIADKNYTLHSLRHGFGLHLYESGVDLMSIKEALGHKSLNSTTVYVSLGIGNGRTVVSPYDRAD